MRNLLILVFVLASTGCAQQIKSGGVPTPPPPVVVADPDKVPAEDAVPILLLQVKQLRIYGEMEHNRAESLQLEKDVDAATKALQRAVADLRVKMGCLECNIGDDMRLIRPIPATPEVRPNK